MNEKIKHTIQTLVNLKKIVNIRLSEAIFAQGETKLSSQEWYAKLKRVREEEEAQESLSTLITYLEIREVRGE